MEGNTRTQRNIVIYAFLSLIMFVSILFICLCPSSARADGGAPQLAYVAGGGQGVSVIDIATQRVRRTFTETGGPSAVLLSLDGQSFYLAQPALGRVAIINASTGQLRCAAALPGQPALMALSLDGSVLYTAGQGDSSVRALNPQNCAIEKTFPTRQPIYGLAVTAATAANATPDTPNQLWISGTTSLSIFEVTGHALGTIPMEQGPRNISIPGGFTAYITTRQGSVIAIDLNTRRLLRTLLTGGQFGPMDYDATTGQIYVPDSQHKQLAVLNPVTAGSREQPREPAHIFQLNSAPQAVAITNDGQLGFVALANGEVVMLDIPARNIITSIHVAGTPHFIVTGLYPPASAHAPLPASTTTTATPATLINKEVLTIILLILFIGALLWIAFWLYQRYRQHRDNQS
ncbi:YncE family protein [Dictyobacter kobayashii]|uniref:YncE family protein n=1 Tax=Dictyobacter kobayashii TaxID=2014872 RepID=A0A402ANV3_9CHLR|nr:hypothetical protein [Dictyobacter kobayashii]GCE20772.1 hypothetical protein KDK_45720 [Dictyobacter kobayashii]